MIWAEKYFNEAIRFVWTVSSVFFNELFKVTVTKVLSYIESRSFNIIYFDTLWLMFNFETAIAYNIAILISVEALESLVCIKWVLLLSFYDRRHQKQNLHLYILDPNWDPEYGTELGPLSWLFRTRLILFALFIEHEQYSLKT